MENWKLYELLLEKRNDERPRTGGKSVRLTFLKSKKGFNL
jgi:hypothetical protein